MYLPPYVIDGTGCGHRFVQLVEGEACTPSTRSTIPLYAHKNDLSPSDYFHQALGCWLDCCVFSTCTAYMCATTAKRTSVCQVMPPTGILLPLLPSLLLCTSIPGCNISNEWSVLCSGLSVENNTLKTCHSKMKC